MLVATFILVSCGGSKKDVKEDAQNVLEEVIEDAEESSEFAEAKNCDEFIDQYEEWMDNYIDLLDKYMKNPMDATLMEDYMKVAEEGTNWMTQWTTKLMPCAAKEKYQKRFDEISERADKKLAEMGIE